VHRQIGELLEIGLVEAQLGRTVRRAAQTQGQVQLAARDALRGALAQRAFLRTQLIGQAQAEFEIAVVDAAQLHGNAPQRSVAFNLGVGGHAADHAHSGGGERGQW